MHASKTTLLRTFSRIPASDLALIDTNKRRPGSLRGRIVDLSHPIHDGLITYPGLPAPEIRPHLTRAQSRSRYEPGTEFQIDAITMVGKG